MLKGKYQLCAVKSTVACLEMILESSNWQIFMHSLKLFQVRHYLLTTQNYGDSENILQKHLWSKRVIRNTTEAKSSVCKRLMNPPLM